MSLAVENAIKMPLIALRGLVVFPGMLISFDVGRQKSAAALKYAMVGFAAMKPAPLLCAGRALSWLMRLSLQVRFATFPQRVLSECLPKD